MIRSIGIRRCVFVACLLLVGTVDSMCGLAESVPLVLLYGFQPVPGFRAMQLWEDVAEALSGTRMTNAKRLVLSENHAILHLPAANDAHRTVFISDYALTYEPTVRSLFFYTQRFAEEIEYLSTHFNQERFDVVGHSTGGLIARAYAEIEDFSVVLENGDFEDYGIKYGGAFRTIITLATPHHGADLAVLGQWFSTLSRQLAPGSRFLRLLNADRWIEGKLTSLNPDIRYVSLAAQTCVGCGIRRDETGCLKECVEAGLRWQGSDLVIMMASAYLPEAENTALIGLDHVSMHTHSLVADAIDRILSGETLPAALFGTEELRTAVPSNL